MVFLVQQLPYKLFPRCPSYALREQEGRLCNTKVAFVLNQSHIREQKTQSTSISLVFQANINITVAYTAWVGIQWICFTSSCQRCAATAWFADKIVHPEAVTEKVTRERFEVYPVPLPHEVQIHLFNNHDVARSRPLVVERSWWHWSAS